MHRVYLSLGSNMGNPIENIERAIEWINDHEEIKVLIISCFYKTKPYGGVEQDDFVNIVAEVETSLSPLELLDYCQWVEEKLHRVREIHWGPRTIDVDILTFDEVVINEERLVVPHPEMFKRGFVLIPLQEICNSDMLYHVNIAEKIGQIDADEIRKM